MEKISSVKTKVCSEKQLSEWIDTYEKLIFSICYQLTGDYFTAEDLTQETFLAAFQKYHTFDGGNEKAWLCRIAANKGMDYLRSAGRRAVPTQGDFFEELAWERGSPEAVCMEEEVRGQLQRCCRALKPPYNEVARAYYLEELSPAEIAACQGKSVKTIQTQIYRAREMLKELYRKEEKA